VSVVRSAVTGVGSFLPEQVVTNADLAEIVDTSDAWIQERTGIKQRHRARDDQPTSDLATEAARRALVDAGRTEADVDLIIVATTTPDMTFPSVASIVQRKLGAPVCIALTSRRSARVLSMPSVSPTASSPGDRPDVPSLSVPRR